MRAPTRRAKCKDKPRPTDANADTADEQFAAAIKRHATERCNNPRVAAWLLALAAGDRIEVKAEKKPAA